MEHNRTGSDPLWARLLFMLGYWMLGCIAFSVAVLFGIVQLVVLWVRGEQHGGLGSSGRLFASYACDCLEYIVFVSNDKPFPLGPLPKEK